MVEVLTALLIGSAIIFFGFFAEFLFNRFKIPDELIDNNNNSNCIKKLVV